MTIEQADRLIALRKENGLSQEELAVKIGVSRQAVSKWERAESSPDTDNLIALSELYGVSLDELLSLTPKKTEKTAIIDEKPTTETPDDDDELKSTKYLIIDCISLGVIVIAYILIGTLKNLWHPAWILFLLIPLIHSALNAIEKRNPSKFAYPVLATIIFLLLGFYFNAWHPSWVIFITIPVYYTLATLIKSVRKN